MGVDDFIDQYQNLPVASRADVLRSVIANLKSSNQALKFGATIYTDQLDESLLQDASLPADVRAQFDNIHLFIHYRMDGPEYASSVAQAEQLFPNARIIAGAYAFDRRAYLPCSAGGQPCTTQQELDLFNQTITLQVQLLASQQVDSIEFYPGYFGNEAQWDGWTNRRECAPDALSNCITNTQTERQMALTALGLAPPVTETASPSPTPGLWHDGDADSNRGTSRRWWLEGLRR